MPEVTTFWEDAPSGLLRVCDTKQSPADWLLLRVETPVRCHRENLQGSTSLHFVGSHNGNGFRECASSRRSECWVTRTFWGICLRWLVRTNLFPWSHGRESLENHWSFLVQLVLYVQRYCGREKRQVPLTLSDGVLSGSLPQFVPNWVFRKVLCPHTCLIPPGVRSVRRHEKTVFPTKKL